MKKEKRFVFGKGEGVLTSAIVVTDTQTGVQYLYVQSGYSGGLTVLVDAQGNPLVDRSIGRGE